MRGLAGVETFVARLVVLLALAQTCQAALTSWTTTIGPQVMLQNTTTGQIRYSYCNSYGSPIYSYTADTYFNLTYPAKNGTALAGVGWWTNTNTVASIFYIDSLGRVANSLVNCDMASGKFVSQGNWIISDSQHSISNTTGLAALVLGSTAGYRVYYHDSEQAINQITYTNDNGWNYGGYVSQDVVSSNAIHAAFTDSNITVVNPRDSRNVEVSRWNTDNSWHITTTPEPLKGKLTTQLTNRTVFDLNSTAIPTNFTLAAWNGTTKSIGISIDSTHTRYVWYIGTDKLLHEFGSFNFLWGNVSSQSTQFWPAADEPNAELAVTSDFTSSSVYMYYFVNQSLTEIKYTGSAWVPAAALATFNATATATPTPSSTPSNNPLANSSGDSSLSSGAKAGIGVGVSLGVIAIGAIAIAVLFFRRKAARQAETDAAAAAEQPQYPGAAGQQDYKDPNQEYQQAGYPAGYPAEYPAEYAAGHPAGYPAGYAGAYAPDKPQGEYQGAYQPGYTAVYQGGPQQELDSIPTAMEMDPTPKPMYELPHQTYSHELVGSTYPSPMPSQATTEIDSQTYQHHPPQ